MSDRKANLTSAVSELGARLGAKIREETESMTIGAGAASACDHGLTFDLAVAEEIYGSWRPTDAVSFIVGNPKSAEVRKRFPRLSGKCPKGCGYEGIAYVSMDHYRMGDW